MAVTRGTPSRSISPWWALLLLPVCLAFGWFMEREPAPQPVKEVGTPDVWGTEARSVSAPQPAREAEGPTVSQWTSYTNAMAESKRTGKPILIDFNAEWCGPCRMLKQQVFDDFDRGHAMQLVVIPVSIVDRRRERGSNNAETDRLQKEYSVDAFPTMVIFSAKTRRMQKIRGYAGPDRTIEWIKNSAKSVR